MLEIKFGKEKWDPPYILDFVNEKGHLLHAHRDNEKYFLFVPMDSVKDGPYTKAVRTLYARLEELGMEIVSARGLKNLFDSEIIKELRGNRIYIFPADYLVSDGEPTKASLEELKEIFSSI